MSRFQNPIHSSIVRNFFGDCRQPSIEQIQLFHLDEPPWSDPPPVRVDLGNRLKETEQAPITQFITAHPRRDTIIYTDGSAHPEQGLRAAATTEDGRYSRKAFLGKPNLATNFECEATGILLGLELGLDLMARGLTTSIVLLSDSQAALNRMLAPRAPRPGQYLFLHILQMICLIPPGTDILLKWCPGHSDIPGNEAADTLADSAKEDNQTPDSLPPLHLNALKAFRPPPWKRKRHIPPRSTSQSQPRSITSGLATPASTPTYFDSSKLITQSATDAG